MSRTRRVRAAIMRDTWEDRLLRRIARSARNGHDPFAHHLHKQSAPAKGNR